MKGRRVRCVPATKLVRELVEAADEKRLNKTIARNRRVDLLCIDELGHTEPVQPNWAQPRPRWAAHNVSARLAASLTRAASSGSSGTGNETYAPRPPPTGRP
ncbi:hypothetical protein QF026_008361 [Streptomyces aurantiacus]|nr:hypothetical protein [Streptomyces aurantiacus]